MTQLNINQAEKIHYCLNNFSSIIVASSTETKPSILIIRIYIMKENGALKMQYSLEMEKYKQSKILSFDENRFILLRESIIEPINNTFSLYWNLIDPNEFIKTNKLLNENKVNLTIPVKSNELNEQTFILNDICLTSSKKYLVFFLNNQLFYVDINKKEIVIQKTITSNYIDSIDYFITPINVSMNSLYNFSNILNDIDKYEDNNDVICMNSFKQISIQRYCKLNERISTILSETNCFESFKTSGNVLLAFSKQLNKLMCFDLCRVIDEKSLDSTKNVFKYKLNKSRLDNYGISSDFKYFFIVKDLKIILLFRWSDKQLVREFPMYSQIVHVFCSSEFISLGMKDRRIVSFVIIKSIKQQYFSSSSYEEYYKSLLLRSSLNDENKEENKKKATTSLSANFFQSSSSSSNDDYLSDNNEINQSDDDQNQQQNQQKKLKCNLISSSFFFFFSNFLIYLHNKYIYLFFYFFFLFQVKYLDI